MKKTYFAMMAIAAVTLTSCGAKTEEKEEAAEITYNLDAEATTLQWTGKYVADGHTHTGTVKVSEGNIVYKGDEFVSGDFKVDMRTIQDNDLPAAEKGKLEGHLHSADFFNTAEYANVPVVINSVTDKEITATLTVLGKEIKAVMPLKIDRNDKKFTAKGKFDIDFAALDINGFKAMPDGPENMKTSSVISFDLNLVLKK